MIRLVVVLLALALAPTPAHAEEAAPERRHSIDISPLSPFIRIYAVQYSYEFSPANELILGPAYMNIRYAFGETNAPALILGYRRYLWRNLHVEYQVWPIVDWFWEANEKKTYFSYDLWNEARVGYRFDFELAGLDAFVNLQWALGFGLYAGNKPESFLALRRESPIFTAPLIFCGLRF